MNTKDGQLVTKGYLPNFFTKHIDSVVSASMSEFEKKFKAQIDENFRTAALASAVKILSEKLGLK